MRVASHVARRSLVAAVAVLLGCGMESIEKPEPSPLPPLRWPAPTQGDVGALQGQQAPRDNDSILSMSTCLRRSSVRVEELWNRIRLDLDVESGERLRDRRDVQPWVPRVHGDLASCSRVNPPEGPPELVRTFQAYRDATLQIAEGAEALAAYFDEGRYEQDAWAFAQSAVPALASQIETWNLLREQLHAALLPAQAEILEVVLRNVPREAQQHPGTVALRLLQSSESFATCLSGSELSRCAGSRAEVSAAVADLEAWLQRATDSASIPFWGRAMQKSAADFARLLAELEGPLRRGKLSIAHRRELDQARQRVQNAAELVRREELERSTTPRR